MSLYKLSAIAFAAAAVVFVAGLLLSASGIGGDNSEGIVDTVVDAFTEGVWVSVVTAMLVFVGLCLLIAGWWIGRRKK